MTAGLVSIATWPVNNFPGWKLTLIKTVWKKSEDVKDIHYSISGRRDLKQKSCMAFNNEDACRLQQ